MKKASIWCNPYRYWVMYGILCLIAIGCDPTYSDQQEQIGKKNALGSVDMLFEGLLNPRFELRQKDLQALEHKKEEELKKIVHIPQAVVLSSAQCVTLKQQLKLGIEIMYDLEDLQQLLRGPFKELVKSSVCQGTLDPLLIAVIQRLKERVETMLSNLDKANQELAAFEAIIDDKNHEKKATDQAYINPLIADIRLLLSNLEKSISIYQLLRFEHFLFGDSCSCLSFVTWKICPPITIVYPTFYISKQHPMA
ncbi:MAG: hypothetical protein K2X94_01640 [Amoebophilaceae bacterium]|nr:hypothetical protein [Amoebophilaceae bacterium]